MSDRSVALDERATHRIAVDDKAIDPTEDDAKNPVETPMLMPRPLPKKRGRPKKVATGQPISTAGRLYSSLLPSQSSTPNVSSNATTPSVTSVCNSLPQPKDLLSSAASPLKTPVPKKANVTIQSRTTPKLLPKPAVEATPKFESWTSRFVKNPSLGAPREPSLQSYHLPIVDLPPIGSPLRTREEIACSSLQSLAALISEEQPIPISVPASSVEFVPPPTVTRRPVRRDLPPEYTESPLARAKRVDAQNQWREEQLRNFLSTKTDNSKYAPTSGKSPLPSAQDYGSSATGPLPTSSIDQVSSQPVGPAKRTSIVALLSNETISSHPESDGVPLSRSFSDIPQFENIMDVRLPENEPPASPNMRISDILNPGHTHDYSDFLLSHCSKSSLDTTKDLQEDGVERQSISDACKPPIDSAEIEKRKRLKERNDKALEKRKLLLQKAQQKSNQTSVVRMGPLSLQSMTHPGTKVPISRPASHLPVRVRPSKKHKESTSLQKQVMVKNAIKKASPPQPASPLGQDSGAFKLPLPKAKTPAKPDHPVSDDTFNIPVETKQKETASPKLPEIPTEYVGIVCPIYLIVLLVQVRRMN